MIPQEIPNHWEGSCFGCSKTNTYGLHLRFWLSKQGCFTKCTIPDYLCGIDGLVHGGILATLLDEVGEWTIISRLGRFGMTREISIRYLKPVQTNTELLIEGQIISHDDKNGDLHGTIHSVDGTLLTESRSKWIFPNLSNIAKAAKVEESVLQEFLAKYSQKSIQNRSIDRVRK